MIKLYCCKFVAKPLFDIGKTDLGKKMDKHLKLFLLAGRAIFPQLASKMFEQLILKTVKFK